MNTIQIILGGLALAYAGIHSNGQNNSDSIRITYRNKTVNVKPQGDESFTTVRFRDTALNKKVVVKVGVFDDGEEPSLDKEEIDSNAKKVIKMMRNHKFGEDRKKFIETSWFPTFDIGFAGTDNEQVNDFTFTPKLNKSANLGIGIVRQNMNLVKGQLLLSYGLSLNNYYLKYSDKQQVQYLDEKGLLNSYRDSVYTFRKHRLDVRYLSVPVMLEYHTANNNFNIAAGVEFSFNGHTKSIQKGERDGKDFEGKSDVDVKINPTQMAAVLRIGIDNVAIFGKYQFTDMYKSSAFSAGMNPGQHLYSFGVCLFGI